MTTPPIVGVPAFVVWPDGTSSWIGWPMLRARSQSIRKRVPTRANSSAVPAARRRPITSSPWPSFGGATGTVRQPAWSSTVAGDGDVVEGQHLVADGLRRLVALAGDQHDVARIGADCTARAMAARRSGSTVTLSASAGAMPARWRR